MRLSSLLRPSLLLLLASCATTGTPTGEMETHPSGSGLYTLELSRSFRTRPAPHKEYDAFYAWSARDWIVGVIVDDPPESLERLDEAIAGNALAADLPAEIVRVSDAELGGLRARRTEIVLEVENTKVLMLNTHVATSQENVQLIVSGPLGDARALRELSASLEAGGFRFAPTVTGLKATPPYDLSDEALPIRFSSAPDGWTSARRGSVNSHAFLELRIIVDDMWFMGIHEVLEGQVAEEAMSDPEYMDRYARAVHDEMAAVLQAVPPGSLEPFDSAGSALDRRWSLGGLFREESVPITYRFRVIQRGPEVVRLYCWGQPTVDVKGRCDALFDLISLAPEQGTRL